uniref:Uncharacterized protein n=1 Tax=Anguilla anguilla TaxID=7936 RepID=A0A0E9U8A9_ANGAN
MLCRRLMGSPSFGFCGTGMCVLTVVRNK